MSFSGLLFDGSCGDCEIDLWPDRQSDRQRSRLAQVSRVPRGLEGSGSRLAYWPRALVCSSVCISLPRAARFHGSLDSLGLAGSGGVVRSLRALTTCFSWLQVADDGRPGPRAHRCAQDLDVDREFLQNIYSERPHLPAIPWLYFRAVDVFGDIPYRDAASQGKP